jgi:hypothetical protein
MAEQIPKVAQAVKKTASGAVSTKERESIQPEEKALTTCIIAEEGHENVGHYCFSILGEVVADKDKKKLPQKWLRNYELYRAKHWKSQGKTRLSTVNLIWNYITRTVSLLTDQNPTFDIMAENDKVASLIHKVARYWWNETEQQAVLSDSVTMSEINGCVVEKTVFNNSLNNGIGEVETITVDPYNFGFWPLDERRQEKCEANLHYYTIPVNQARRLWPDMADYITSDKLWRDKLGENRREIFGGTTSSKHGGDYGVDHATYEGNIEAIQKVMGGKGDVLILEFWVKDFTQIDVVIEPERREPKQAGTTSDEAGHSHEYVILDMASGNGRVTTGDHEHIIVSGLLGPGPDGHTHGLEMEIIPEVTGKQAKYPGNIRCITCCNGGDIVLSDRPNPSINPLLEPELASMTYLWSRFPFYKAESNRDIVSPWGFSSIEQLEMMNFEIDKCLTQLNIVKDKAVRSPVINPRNAQVPNSAFTNAPAKVINPKDHIVGAAIQHMKPPAPQRDIEQILGIYREMFDKIAGIFDMTDPSIAKGRMAFKTVATIIESMHTMLRGKIRGYGKMIRERGRMWLSHAQNFYTEERIFFVEREGGSTETGELVGKDLIIPLHFTVEAGSTMPTSRLQQREEAKELHGQGAIDIRELLIRLDWPNREEVIHRMEMGQFGALLERLNELGMNPEIVEAVTKVAEMDDQEYNAALNQMKEVQADATKGQLPGGQNAAV